MKKVLKKIVFDVIESTDYITKAEIKDQVLDYAVKNKILTKEFVIAFGDIGWVFQDLRQIDESIDCVKDGRNWFWYAT
tara:strand:+ start:552 stop:785 length:234 start_codon:yes stop_codon:yes gene_type:complete